MWYKFYVRKRTSDISPSLLWFSAAWHWKTHLHNRSYLILYRTRFITVYQAHFVFLDTTSNYFSRDRRDKNSFNLNVKQKISIDLESPLLAFRESNIPFSREGKRERERKNGRERITVENSSRSSRSIGSLNEEESAWVREKSGSRVRLRREISRFEDRLIIPSAGGGRGWGEGEREQAKKENTVESFNRRYPGKRPCATLRCIRNEISSTTKACYHAVSRFLPWLLIFMDIS